MSGSRGDGRRSAVRAEICLTGADDGDLRLLYCRNVAAAGGRGYVIRSQTSCQRIIVCSIRRGEKPFVRLVLYNRGIVCKRVSTIVYPLQLISCRIRLQCADCKRRV